MSRARPRTAPRRSAGLLLALFALVSLFAVLLVQAKPCLSFTLATDSLGSPAIRNLARSRTVEAAPRRLVHEGRRDSRSFDDVPGPVPLTVMSPIRAPLTFARARNTPACRLLPRGAIAHFLRRIPRMNADDPPLV